MLTEEQMFARVNNVSRKMNQIIMVFRHQLGSKGHNHEAIMEASHTALIECAAWVIAADFAVIEQTFIERTSDNETAEVIAETLISDATASFVERIRKHKERGLEKIALRGNL